MSRRASTWRELFCIVDDVLVDDMLDELVDEDGDVLDGYCELGVDDGCELDGEELDEFGSVVCAKAPAQMPAAQSSVMILVR